MSRIRTIKPELLKHEGLFDTEQETGLPIRIAFVGLLTCCDREGRFKWRPRQLKLDALPYDELDFSRVLDALTTRGFLVRYEVEGEVYGCIPSFTKHQYINPRESASELPPPPETGGNLPNEPPSGRENAGSFTRGRRVDDASGTTKPREADYRERERNIGKDNPPLYPPPSGGGEGRKLQKPQKPKPSAEDIDLPDWLSAEDWSAFVGERKATKHPLTLKAAEMAIAELDKLRQAGNDPSAVIRQSIINGWRGLFPLKSVFPHPAAQRASSTEPEPVPLHRRPFPRAT